MERDEGRICVLHITNSGMFLGHFNGQAGFFRDHGIELHAIAPPGRGLDEFGRREGVPVHAVEMSRTIKPLSDLKTVYCLWKLIRRLRPAIVQAHTPKGGIVGMTAAWLAQSPIRIYHLHGLPRVAAGRFYKHLLLGSGRLTGLMAHRVLCVSASARRAALEQRLFPPGKARVLGRGSINGLDSTCRFNPTRVGAESRADVRVALGIPPDARVVGYVGRVVVDKGITELAQAWDALREDHPDAHLIVAGPFEGEDPVPSATREALARDPRVHLVDGWIDNIPPYYAAMDVFVLPSYREGLGSVLLEAASMGLPVVATAVPGCVDAVEDGITGTLVPRRDAAALARAVAAYLADSVLRGEHGHAGRERIIREFDQREAWAALLGEYRELLAARAGRSTSGSRARG